jgi:glutamate synthase (NADPH/NADH) small chain
MPRYVEDPNNLEAHARCLLEELRSQGTLKMKDRLAIPVQTPPVLDPGERSRLQEEVEKPLTPAQAVLESMRCIQCKKPACVKGCPVAIDIPEFLRLTAEGDFSAAIEVIKRTSLLPAICGQQECAVGKSLKDVGRAVAIGKVERFLADWQRNQAQAPVPRVKSPSGRKVAVIGSGPAGLVVAADCRREGHQVTVFEAFHKLGGVLRYGIPEFRLPKEVVDAEIDLLRRMGVEFRTNFVVGRTRKLLDLMDKDGFDAIFIGSGAGLPVFTGMPGEDLVGVFSANEYLTRANMMGGIHPGRSDTPMFVSRRTVVLGGGNVAMDACRMARRLGAEEVIVLYRRSRAEMPARAEEVEHALEEGIEIRFLENALEVLGDGSGRVRAVTVQRYALGEPDSSGRRRPLPIEGDTYELPADAVLVAIGNNSNPLLTSTTPGLEVNSRGNIVVDPETGSTSLERVFAGGDIVLGAATVILAMGEGRRAARSINEMLAREAIEEAADAPRAHAAPTAHWGPGRLRRRRLLGRR